MSATSSALAACGCAASTTGARHCQRWASAQNTGTVDAEKLLPHPVEHHEWPCNLHRPEPLQMRPIPRSYFLSETLCAAEVNTEARLFNTSTTKAYGSI